MDNTSGSIRLAVHTPGVASSLQDRLESHGIAVTTTPLNVTGVEAVAVNVPADALAAAIKIMESGRIMAIMAEEMKMAGMSREVLIPVDFSDLSMTAVTLGFGLARRLEAKAVVVHAYPSPALATTVSANPFPGDLTFESEYPVIPDSPDYKTNAERTMKQFAGRINDRIKAGKIDSVPYITLCEAGVPEEVIKECCVMRSPVLVVMATRGRERRAQDLVGSVTAEVLDTCRVPVFTVPDGYTVERIESIRKLAFFCNLDRQDVMSIDFLMRLFDFPDVEVALVPVSAREEQQDAGRLEAFREYLTQNYPEAEFTLFQSTAGTDFRTSISNFLHDAGMQLLIVPNKKKNIFTRFFNPGIPHRVLYERDIPMLALPV